MLMRGVAGTARLFSCSRSRRASAGSEPLLRAARCSDQLVGAASHGLSPPNRCLASMVTSTFAVDYRLPGGFDCNFAGS